MRTGSFAGLKQSGLGVNHHPHLEPRLMKRYSYTSTAPLSLCGLLLDELYLPSARLFFSVLCQPRVFLAPQGFS